MQSLKLLLNRQTRQAALLLAAFAAVCIIAVSLIYLAVADKIEQQITQATLMQFRDIAPNLAIDDSLLDSEQSLTLGGHTVAHYQHKTKHQVQADFFKATTSKGYSGDITLLIGISADKQTLLGVRTLAHKETPGLGDKIETRISPWILSFSNTNISASHYAVRKDGGDFDAFTGATITPRAVTGLINDITAAWQQTSQP